MSQSPPAIPIDPAVEAARAKISILVVGAGPVGHALSSGLARAGYSLRHWSRSRGPLWAEAAAPQPADIVILAVRDEAIAPSAQYVVTHGAAALTTVLLHCAGALPPSEAFAEVREKVRGIGLLHPLRSFSLPPSGDAASGPLDGDLHGTVLALAGDAVGLQTAQDLAHALGGQPLPMREDQLGAYHAAAALAAGHVAALLEVSAHMLSRIGLPRSVAEPAVCALTVSVLTNIARVGLPAALTGPIARGDVGTVRRHLQSLDRLSTEVSNIYRALGYTAVDLAYRKGAAPPDQLEQVADLLIAPPGPPGARS